MEPYFTTMMLWKWIIFIILILILLFIDLKFLKAKNNETPSATQALKWSLFWIALSLFFNLMLWFYLSKTTNTLIANQKSLEFFAGYLLEKSLSIDNIFVFVLIFKFFKVHPQYQKKILFLGILGAIILRFVMITGGLFLIHQFEWMIYLFGLLLIYSSVKLVFLAEQENDLNQNKLFQIVKSILPLTPDLHKDKFIIRVNSKIFFTPLFLVLCFIEISDVIFAIDSIPAIFGVTQDPFIIFTSNIFAILGLRALYFLFADMSERFLFLKHGIAVILMFIGLKMLISGYYKIPITISLMFIALSLGISIIFSLLLSPNEKSKNENT